MVDRLFVDPRLAALYDPLTAPADRDDFAFYLPLVLAADAVLDVGCGTGALLHLARQRGHTGRLCGLDPAEAMLDVARDRSDVEWILGHLATTRFDTEFDLVVMTGHAFQVLLDDAELRAALDTVRNALTDEGRFAFETRNPSAREWERWTPDDPLEVGGVVYRRRVDAVDGELVTFTGTFESAALDRPEPSTSTLRFLDAPTLDAFLTAAGFVVAERYGDWDRAPLADGSPEIVTIASTAR